jgi:hypothetical protein
VPAVDGYLLTMDGHENESDHTLEDEQRPDDSQSDAPNDAQNDDQDADQDAEPSLNAPGDADPSGVDTNGGDGK